jgi:hypothetical protein
VRYVAKQICVVLYVITTGQTPARERVQGFALCAHADVPRPISSLSSSIVIPHFWSH